MENIVRYIVTDVVSIPITRIAKKSEAYKWATSPGWGLVEWYSQINNYSLPVNRDRSDKTQELHCDDDSSAVIYPRYGQEFVISSLDKVELKNVPKQAETEAILISDSCGYSFWEKDNGDIKLFVTYDKNGLIDCYRLGNWTDTIRYDDETEIKFEDLQSEEEYETINRVDIIGTYEHERKNNIKSQIV